jgi:GNAT superfamily N-acetyltransferase
VKFFEDYGFQDYFQQFTFRTKLVDENLSPVVRWKAKRLLNNPDYRVQTYREVGKKKAIDALLYVYNKAWNSELHGVDKLKREQVEHIYKSLQPIIDKDVIYFIFHQEEPVGFFLVFPEINHAVKHVNGKMNLHGIIKFMYHRHVKKIHVALGQLFGVIPEYQNKGVEAAMIVQFCEYIYSGKTPYVHLEMNWVGDFNPPMVHLMSYLNAHKSKIHITYRKPLRDGIKIVRAADKNK